MQEVRLIDANALHDRVSRMGLQNGSVLATTAEQLTSLQR